jgi:hypothetical protein
MMPCGAVARRIHPASEAASMSQAATSSDRDYDAIRDTIFDYFDGVRLADRKRLEQAFAVDAGHMKGYLKGADGTWTLSVRPMREVIDDWAGRTPKPEMQGRILKIDIYDDVAATVLFDFNGMYTDSFNLARVDGRWKIVNKFYTGR